MNSHLDSIIKRGVHSVSSPRFSGMSPPNQGAGLRSNPDPTLRQIEMLNNERKLSTVHRAPSCYFFCHQCCGSGSGSTWIRILLAVLDPDPYWECGSRSIEIDQNLQKKPCFLPFKKAFCTFVFVCMFFWPITYSKYIFRVKLFVT